MRDERGPCLLRVRLSGGEDMLRQFLRAHPPGCERVEPDPYLRGQLTIEADLEAGMIPTWVSLGLKVEVLYDIAQRGRELLRRVGKGNRFAKHTAVQGLGTQRKRGT